MKRLNGNNILVNLILIFTFVLMCSCSRDTTRKIAMIYENTLDQNVKITAYMGYKFTDKEWALLIPPHELGVANITRFSSEGPFELNTSIKLEFDDGRSITYDELSDPSYGQSPTNLFNISIYDDSENGVFKVAITEKHYNESSKEEQ